SVKAYDGIAYSGWASVDVSAVNNVPVVSVPAANVRAAAGQILSVASLFSPSDANGDALTYFLYDETAGANTGKFVVNGTTVPERTIYAVNAAQFAQATFVAGTAGALDGIYVQAFDGLAYSGWNSVVRVAANHAPVVNVPLANVSADAKQGVPVSS